MKNPKQLLSLGTSEFATVAALATAMTGSLQARSWAALQAPPREDTCLTLTTPGSTPSKWVGVKKLAVVLIDLKGKPYFDPRLPAAKLEARKSAVLARFFKDPDSLRAYWLDVSYGKFSIAGHINPGGDLFGPVYVDLPPDPINPLAFAEGARAALRSLPGFDPDDYDLIAYTHPLHRGSVGLPFFDPPSAIMDNLSLRALSHEMGHAIGLSHSSALACEDLSGPVTLSEVSTAIEYGDIFDTMGGTGAMTYNQQKRGSKGWLDPETTMTVTAPVSGLALYPIGATGTQTKVLRVPRVVGPFGIEQYIYVEFRQPTFFDSFDPGSPVANGTLIRLGPGYDQIGQTFLLDAKPSGTPMINRLGGATDAPFVPLGTTPVTPAVFVDPTTGTIIRTDGVFIVAGDVESSYATVSITPGSTVPCNYADPVTVISPSLLTVQLQRTGEASATIGLTLTNNDSKHCPPLWVTGKFSGVPASWGSRALPGFERKLSGQEMTAWSVDGHWPATSLTGTTTVTLETLNSITGHMSKTGLEITVLPAP